MEDCLDDSVVASNVVVLNFMVEESREEGSVHPSHIMIHSALENIYEKAI